MPKNIDKIKLLFILMCAKVYMNCKTPEKTKTLMMHYYGNGEGVFQDAVDDVENGIDRVKNFTEEKWNDFKDKLE